jgi:hypothetical protein
MGLLDNIVGAESGNDPTQQSTTSSAGGLGGFINGTWLSMINKYRPDLAQANTPQQLIAMKTDPSQAQLSRDMTANYAGENQQFLKSNGLDPSDANTYLAHFAGPSGAVSVLRAAPSTPVSQLLKPDAMKANPFLANMTAADLTAFAARKAGGGAQPTQPASQATAGQPFNSQPAYSWSQPGQPAAPAPPQATPAATPSTPVAPGPSQAVFQVPQAPQQQLLPPRGQQPSPQQLQLLLQAIKNAPPSVRGLYARNNS